jgi:hypothetical protein
MQPAGQGPEAAQGSGLVGQDEEGRLAGVLGVLFVAQHVAANAVDQRAVTAHQLREGRLVPPGGEVAQEAAVGVPFG